MGLPDWPPLKSCRPETRALLERAAQALHLAPGEALVESGRKADRVVLAGPGVLRVFHAEGPEVQFTVKLLRGPGAMGEVEALRGTASAASVEALTPNEAVVIPAAALREAVAQDPDFTRALLFNMAEKFEATIRASREHGFGDCETRLVWILLEYAAHFGRPVERGLEVRFALPRERLAREIGAARRSVDRALAALTSEQLIEQTPKGWRVLRDLDELRKRAARIGG